MFNGIKLSIKFFDKGLRFLKKELEELGRAGGMNCELYRNTAIG